MPREKATGTMIRPALVIASLLLLTIDPAATALAQGPGVPNPQPQFWVIAVGIDDYQNRAIPQSTGSVRQAQTLLRWLRNSGGWDRSHLLELADLGSAQPGDPRAPAPRILPTKRNLEWAVQLWLASRARPGDVVIFYYAGQTGSVVSTDPKTHESTVDYFLMPDRRRSR